MIKYAILLFVFISLLISPAGVLAQSNDKQAVLSLEPASGTFNKGCNFSLNVNLDTAGARTDGTDAILIYDVSRFKAVSIENGTIYLDYPGNNIDLTGRITISGLASVSTPFTGKGTLAKINFKVNDTAPTGATEIKFEYSAEDRSNTRDSNVVERDTVEDLLASVINGNYIIGTGPCTTTQSPLPSSSPRSTALPRGGPNSTPSATPLVIITTPIPTPQTVLPPAGSEQLTFTLAIVGGLLTVLGILGLALL